MDFKGALLKGMKEISSSSSLKLYPTQPRSKIEPQQLSSMSSSSTLRDSQTELNPKQHEPKIEIQPLSSSSILRDSSTDLVNPRQPKPEIKVHKISSRPEPKIKIQHSSSFSILQDPLVERNKYPDWLDLPRELMESIMQRIGWYDVLMNAKKVCRTWHEICKGLSVWQNFKIQQATDPESIRVMERINIFLGDHAIKIDCEVEEIDCEVEAVKLATKLAMHVVDSSSGQLLDLCIHGFGSNHLLEHISYRSRQLRRLRLEYCRIYPDDYEEPHDFSISEEGLTQLLRNLPLLEDLQFLYTSTIPVKCIEAAGRCCPGLKSFTLNARTYYYSRYPSRESNAHALAIVRNMSRIHRLQLLGNRMTVRGLKAILNHCHCLEYLDLRQCYNLSKALKEGTIERRLRRQIKHVRFPGDSTEDCQFDAKIYESYESDGTLFEGNFM